MRPAPAWSSPPAITTSPALSAWPGTTTNPTAVIARSEATKQSNLGSGPGLLRFARNDGVRLSQRTSLEGSPMSDRLKGKRAFVSAAAAGIGRASAIAFAREGAHVFATDIDEKGLATLKAEGISEVAKLDARDTAAVADIAKRAGKTDILLNAAGFV